MRAVMCIHVYMLYVFISNFFIILNRSKAAKQILAFTLLCIRIHTLLIVATSGQSHYVKTMEGIIHVWQQ